MMEACGVFFQLAAGSPLQRHTYSFSSTGFGQTGTLNMEYGIWNAYFVCFRVMQQLSRKHANKSRNCMENM